MVDEEINGLIDCRTYHALMSLRFGVMIGIMIQLVDAQNLSGSRKMPDPGAIAVLAEQTIQFSEMTVNQVAEIDRMFAGKKVHVPKSKNLVQPTSE